MAAPGQISPEGAEIIDPPGDKVLQALPGAAIRDVRGIDTRGGGDPSWLGRAWPSEGACAATSNTTFRARSAAGFSSALPPKARSRRDHRWQKSRGTFSRTTSRAKPG